MEKEFDICCGVDVGKWEHHFTAVDRRTGEVVLDEKVEQSEREIAARLGGLSAMGKTMVVVDQPGSLASLLIAVADSLGVARGFITPTAMSRAIDMYGGDLKTDAHDAFVIAEVGASLPRIVKPIDERQGDRSELSALMSYDRELTVEGTRASNRLHDLLLSLHPALERHMSGGKIRSEFNLLLLERYGGPCGLRDAGRRGVRRWVKSRKGMGSRALAKVDEVFEVLAEQELEIAGGRSLEGLVKSEAAFLLATIRSRREVAAKRDAVLARMPEAQILLSLPGTGPVTCATFIAEVGDASAFDSSAKLAAYAGLSPKVRQSGRSVHSITKPRGGNRRLKRVLILSASKSILFCEESRAYYERKRAEGRGYNSAVTALARKRLDVMYAMLRDRRPYERKNG